MDRTDDWPNTWQAGRRKPALARTPDGWKPWAMAAAVGVSAAAVSQGVAAAHTRGSAAWRAKPRPTGPAKLTADHWPMMPAR